MHESTSRLLAVTLAASAAACGGSDETIVPLDYAELGQAHRRAAPPQFVPLGRVDGGAGFDEDGAEIVAFDAASARLFVTNVGLDRVDVIDMHDPSAPVWAAAIDTTPHGAQPNGVAVSSRGVVAVAIEAEDPQAPGVVAFFDVSGAFLSQVTVGALPDMVTFTPNGRYALVANEGEPNDGYGDPALGVDPEGSISVIRLRHGAGHVDPSDVRTADFSAFNESIHPDVRISGPGATPAQDLEPEYVAVSADSRTAWVTLQENNAIAIVDVRRARVLDVVPLGYKDHSLPGNGLDASDRDDAIHVATQPVRGLYMPDAIASYRSRGRTYLVTANEGDGREYGDEDEPPFFTDEARCKDLVLDETAFPDAEALQANEALGRLSCVTTEGDVDGDGDHDELYSFGARSFSIWDARARQVFDSGDEIEQTMASLMPEQFNSTDDENDSFDSRSDAKGPEPEGVAVGDVRGRSYAFVGLERIGGILAYDVTRPSRPRFVDYVNTRDFAGVAEDGTAGDLAPEGLLFIAGRDSPTGKALVVAAFEISGTTRIFEFD